MTGDLHPPTSASQLQSVLETAPDTILTVDRAGTILFINRVNAALTVAQVVGTSCYHYVPADQRARVEQAIERVFRDRVIDEYEVQGPPDPTGRRAWSHVRAGPLVEDGRVVAATLCATDITVRKELVERLQKIASQVPGVVFQFKRRPDGSFCFPYASERIREIYRVSPEEVAEDATKVLEVLHPDDVAGVVAAIQDSARTLAPWQREYRVRFPDGTVRWLYGNSLPEREADGSVLWHGFITDVTERKNLDDQLRHSQKAESIGRLAGGMAHDFNNLLTSVLGFAELARELLPPGSPAAPHLQRVIESGMRCASLTEQLLAFARKKIVRPEPVDLNETLARLEPMIRRLVGTHIRVDLALSPRPAVVRIDPGSLEQVVMNLVLNARDAMPRGGTLRLATAHEAPSEEWAGPPAGPRAVVDVSDTGFGMSPEVLARIFEPFYTTKAPGRGTGLGLAMAQGILRQAGGDISALSEVDKGSRVRICLPALEGAELPVERAEPPRGTARGTETLLLVEDEPLILAIAANSCRALGYRVLAAAGGAEALRLADAEAAPIHLLVTDVVMPGMGGRELADRLRERRPGLKVLFASGHTEDAIVDHGVLEAGLQFLQKPYTPSILAGRIREILDAPPATGRLPGSGS